MMTHWLRAALGGLVVLAAAAAFTVPATAASNLFEFRPIWAPPPGLSYADSPFARNRDGARAPLWRTERATRRPVRVRGQERYQVPEMFDRQRVSFPTREGAGTIIVDTGHKFLYLVTGNGEAIRYGIGTARDGFEWSGVHRLTSKREWPTWTPPAEMRKRQPGLPVSMQGGIDNPLGARALYIGATLYRIHGTNEPWTIGQDVSSGCIRMLNEDVIDLYGRAKIGAKVVVL